MFNSTTPGDRTREIKQLKEQWHRVNKSVNYFQGCWIKAERFRGSGESDEQVMDNAKAFYEEESDDGEFKLEACWKVLRDQSKWHAYNEDLNGSHKRKYSETKESIPVACRGQYTSGHKHAPTMILEAVATHDLRIWHSYFGVAGANNDINVLNHSPLFIQALKGEAPQAHFSVNGKQYNNGYYLADGIYPQWAAFVKSIVAPKVIRTQFMHKRKKVQAKILSVHLGCCNLDLTLLIVQHISGKRVDVGQIMQACIILHNMIIEDQRQPGAMSFDLN